MACPMSLPLSVRRTSVHPEGVVVIVAAEPLLKVIWARRKSPATTSVGLLIIRLIESPFWAVVADWKLMAAKAVLIPLNSKSKTVSAVKASARHWIRFVLIRWLGCIERYLL